MDSVFDQNLQRMVEGSINWQWEFAARDIRRTVCRTSDVCPICLDPLQQPYDNTAEGGGPAGNHSGSVYIAWVRPCRHVFHFECLQTHMSQSVQGGNCPSCRRYWFDRRSLVDLALHIRDANAVARSNLVTNQLYMAEIHDSSVDFHVTFFKHHLWAAEHYMSQMERRPINIGLLNGIHNVSLDLDGQTLGAGQAKAFLRDNAEELSGMDTVATRSFTGYFHRVVDIAVGLYWLAFDPEIEFETIFVGNGNVATSRRWGNLVRRFDASFKKIANEYD